MRLEIDIVLKLTHEQQKSTEHLNCNCQWPHPWEHYPFQIDGKREWIRYQDLRTEQKQLLLSTLGGDTGDR